MTDKQNDPSTRPTISFTVDAEKKKRLQALADKEHRTLGAQISYLMDQFVFPHLDAQPTAGFSSPTPQPVASN